MGRTKRKRCRKKPRSFDSCDHGEELVLFNKWLHANGVRRNEKLSLAVFEDTGRGVLTKKKIRPGEELINLPLNLTINVSTILLDTTFCYIFLENTKQCLSEYKQTISFHSMMAFYLTFLKVQEQNTKWYIYLQNLPKEYTVPYFLTDELKSFIDPDLLTVISKQKDVIDSSFSVILDILNSNVSENEVIKEFKNCFTKSDYEWAYFTVNTRCVYMDLSKVIDLKNIENTILNLISDNTKISLCPYLDMINHSPTAKNETQLIVSKHIQNINLKDLNADLICDINFSIYTKNYFEPYSEVFICYGDSHNLKLITEYGFFLPDNDLDYVSFSFEDVHTFLSKTTKLSQDQINFIKSHGLNKDLYIDNRGLSYNFYGLLMVVKYYYNRETDVCKLIYSAAICSNNMSLNDIIKPMVEEKLKKTTEFLEKLKLFDNRCCILDNCVGLMCQFVVILEKFIKR